MSGQCLFENDSKKTKQLRPNTTQPTSKSTLLEQQATSVAKGRIANISKFTDETDTTLLLYRQNCWQVSKRKHANT